MIKKEELLKLSLKEQKDYILGLVKDIETSENKVLISCRKLLFLIKEPSQKLILYIFNIIDKKVKQCHIMESEKKQKNIKDILKKIEELEKIEKNRIDIDGILSDLEFL